MKIIFIVLTILIVVIAVYFFKSYRSYNIASEPRVGENSEVSEKDLKLDKKGIDRLENGTKFLIEEATGRLYKNPNYLKDLNLTLINDFKMRLYNTPKIDESKSTWKLRYIMNSRGIYYSIGLISQESYKDKIYEYWNLIITTQSWATTELHEAEFIITETSDKTGKRTIIKREKEFFPAYNINGENILKIDLVENIKLRYVMEPWKFSDNYNNYPELINNEVIITEESDYKIIPYHY